MKFERNEYPRPQFRREKWQSLNGSWEFAYDDEEKGESLGYCSSGVKLPKTINVPFAYQSEASGIGDTAMHETVWYRRTFEIARDNRGKRALLCFNGVDYEADVWVNGLHVAYHKGAYAPFSADITKYLKDGENVLVVCARDPFEEDIPRGKQSWTGRTFECWYIPTTGIWQSVWLEFFGEDCIQSYTLQSDYDNTAFQGDITTLYGLADRLEITATYNGTVIQKQSVLLRENYTKFYVRLPKGAREDYGWTPETPKLVYIDFALFKGGEQADLAHTRVGLRKIHIDEHGKICLNGRPYYQRLVLDQGYWRESGLTPPSAEALKKDIELAKAMGFNGARKHQKAEDPYFCYYAEEMGFLTWCEMPSAYRYNAKEAQALLSEWQEMLATAKNCTSNVCYVPLNESWGVREIVTDKAQKDFARAMYYTTKAIDGEKLISTNDGFETVNPTDLLGVHDYDSDKAEAFTKYADEQYDGMHPQGFALFADGERYAGEPVLLTEFGGRALQADAKGEAWGYSGAAANEEAFLKQLQGIMKGVYSCNFQGYCYTQLTDVQQEVNGLLTADRKPKADVEKLKELFVGKN